ncbi:peptidase inhibitor family I36 protein [Rathayibacter sp. SD072]|uniref:peptidase inhibitor family I36 protein n=1 Tax=Rathayibacter sp. SD072 TaxID=2781731 RepID=UPI001A960AC1|nr:peptidase inhibitor family I36 protein [Rathayibacter sp. SD072]MBO0982690.1 peptidase inhibitor family I36 protein [Rathayibacter sp. SD072]
MKASKWSIVAVATAVVVTALSGPTAAASGAPLEGTSGEHCAVQIRETNDRGQSETPVCFTTEVQVEEYLSSIGVTDTAGRGVAASTVVGTVYKDSNGSGASLTFFGSSGCAGTTFGFPSLASGWDNSISSVRASNGCWVTLYTATSYGGARLNCTPYCATIGTWNDNVRSLVFRPSGTFG